LRQRNDYLMAVRCFVSIGVDLHFHDLKKKAPRGVPLVRDARR
jgi:hypothetical protein